MNLYQLLSSNDFKVISIKRYNDKQQVAKCRVTFDAKRRLIHNFRLYFVRVSVVVLVISCQLLTQMELRNVQNNYGWGPRALSEIMISQMFIFRETCDINTC